MLVTLIYNPTAGSDDREGSELSALLESAGHSVAIASVRGDRWQQRLADPGDLVVVAGGDGTVRKVFRELATSAVDVTILPVGSANNIARALGLAEADVEQLTRGLADAEVRRFDLGRATAPWGDTVVVESLGVGVFAEVLARAVQVDADDAEDKVESGLRLLAEVLRDLPAREWELEVDDRALSGSYLAVEVMNIRETGPNIPLAPAAEPGDGQLDVVRVDVDDRLPLLDYVEARLRGEPAEIPPLAADRGREVSLRASPPVPIRADDELWHHHSSTDDGDRIRVEGGVLGVRVRVPRARP
jgi:diacylglycerol kinase (ATP)